MPRVNPNVNSRLVQLPSRVWLSVTPWTVAHQASQSFIISLSLLKFMSIESVIWSWFISKAKHSTSQQSKSMPQALMPKKVKLNKSIKTHKIF